MSQGVGFPNPFATDGPQYHPVDGDGSHPVRPMETAKKDTLASMSRTSSWCRRCSMESRGTSLCRRAWECLTGKKKPLLNMDDVN